MRSRSLSPSSLLTAVLACALVASALIPPERATADVLAGTNQSVLVRQPQQGQQAQGDGSVIGLQYADPAEQLVVMDPPQPTNQGDAQLQHPLAIPAGRGIQPNLVLTYDSSNGSGWVGTGWDLSVGAITVDSRWGVPRFSSTKESETYVLDGQVLSPTAVRSNGAWDNRVKDRSDFTFRAESSYDLIIRHGDSPKNYWWEVRDKMGSIRWYGGYPDDGGPDVNVVSSQYGDCPNSDKTQCSLKQDPSAILFDDNGNAYRWALSAQRDVGVNLIRYFYDTVPGQRVGGGHASVGRELYLRSIRYTDAAGATILASPPGVPLDAPYEVRFLRDSDVSPTPAPRKDVLVSGRGGFLEVTSDLLRRVEVWFGAPNNGAPRNYNTLSRAYNLNYEVGAFGKSLLKSVDQIGSDGKVYGTHTFTYFDEVRDANGNYNGFSNPVAWSSGDKTNSNNPDLHENVLTPMGASVLGASQTNSGDVHAYIGFNPADPTKEGSFGGAFTVSGGATESDAEFIDVNGDGLPDKVWREGSNVFFRLNTSGPNLPPGTPATFGDKHAVVGLSRLSTDADVGLAAGVEAHFGVDVGFTLSGDVTIGDDYFADANGDGLPDFVQAGTVYFNHLNTSTTPPTPTFDTSSANTQVPINVSPATVPSSKQITDLEAKRRQQSPLQDTIRRWVAPFDGTVSVDGAVTLDTRLPGDPATLPPYTGDGVRVTIQHNDQELWTSRISTPGTGVTPPASSVGAITVKKGDRIYFRLRSVDDGVRDQVDWDPHVAYTSFSAPPPNDVNGLSQTVYRAADDFTTAGRPHTFGIAPLTGTLHFTGTLNKTKATSDNVTVQVLKNGTVVLSQPVAATFAGVVNLTPTDINVTAPSTDSQGKIVSSDKMEVRIAVDSPIDISALHFDYQVYYTSAVGLPSSALTDSSGNPTIVLTVPADIDIYPQNSLTAPNTPWPASGLSSTPVTVHASLNVGTAKSAGDIIVTVKSATGLVAKGTISVPANQLAQTFSTDIPNVALSNGTNYWFDVSIRNPDVSDVASAQSIQLRWTDSGTNKTIDIPQGMVVLNAAGRQGYFPISYRGWGYAGYNGSASDGTEAPGPINESAFTVDQTNFQNPTAPAGFNDTSFKDASKGPAYAFVPIREQPLDSTGKPIPNTAFQAWRGSKDNILGAAGLMRSSRLGADSVSLGIASGGGITAVRRVGLAFPTFSISAGVGGLSGGFSVGPSFGLQDYQDMNGDGFPDIVSPGQINYTDPRGGFFDTGSGESVVNQDTSFGVQGGINASPIDIKANSKGSVHTAQATAPVSGTGATQTSTSSAQTGGSAAESQYGFNVGGSVGISATFVNPGSANSTTDVVNQHGGTVDVTAPFEQTFVDVNGDGLPDRVTETPQGVFVEFNKGYGFALPITWSDGGFENNESYSGSIGAQLGFTTPERDFSAGLGLSEAVNLPRYQWVDVNGDGILDRLHRDSNNHVMVAFGTNSGLLPEVEYGTMATGTTDSTFGAIPVGPQIAMTDTRGVGAGVDFTIGIGPLCLVACYLIVNPGVHFDHSVASNEIGLIDVDGDGYPDVVKSTADNTLTVSLNKAGRTNLLKTVSNPLGGRIGLDYKRDGNTIAQPFSIWTMSKVAVDDGRPGDGVDIRTSSYDYSDNRYNKLEREMLGYSSVIEHQLVADGSTELRRIEQTYLNDNIFDSGLLAAQVVKDTNGKKLQEADSTWRLIDLKTQTDANLSIPPTDQLRLAVGAVQVKSEQKWYDAGGGVGEDTSSTFEYDSLGNVTKQVDAGQTETTADDATATMVYTGCDNAFNPANYQRIVPSCPTPQLSGGVPPFWTATRCPTWTSLPANLTITTASGRLLRQRNGAPSLCDNSSVTDQKDWFGTGANDFAESILSYDAWGNYNHIEYPTDANSQKRTVDYVYDSYGHGNIATVTESRCQAANSPCSAPPADANALTANAVFDGRTGRIASRTDANNQTTSYTYDAFGRVATITGPYEQGTGNHTVSFEYHTDNAGYAYALAHNFDVLHPGNTIDTATFVDGTGRQTQTKQDATVYTGVTSPAVDVMVVSPAIDLDPLGRAVKVRYPVVEPLGSIGNYNTDKSGAATTITWDLLDRQTEVDAPGPQGGTLVTTNKYEFASYTSPAGFAAKVFKNTVTSPASAANPQGKSEISWVDVRGRVLAVDEGSPALHTDYVYDPLGQLLQVRDNAGNVSTYTYDVLGRRTSTSTPDGGLVESQYDGADNLIAQITPNLRTNHEQIAYGYDMSRLTSIAYPIDTGTPNVSYTYGGPGAPGNAAGRITTVVDGPRTQQLTYDPLGAVASDTDVMNMHNGPSAPLTTSFTHDGFGRLLTLTYPDGEVLSHGYDSGGMLASLEGVKGTTVTDYLKREEYDQFQNKRYQEFGNGVHTEFNFDPATLRLSHQITTTPTRKIQDLNYTYDGVGNVLSMANNADGPFSNLLGGPSTQNYTYDVYDRVVSAKGVAPVAPNKFRDYTYSVSYDANGNVASKNQCDEIVPALGTSCGLKASQTVPLTTYNLSPMTYKPAASGGPHQIATAGGNTYSYDHNGNFTQVVDSKDRLQRIVTWDAANRVRNISDGSSSTDYLYDAAGLLGVQRGPQGEFAFVNNWYQFSNDGWFWRQIWADDDRIAQATEHIDPTTGLMTLFRYYEHNDLQGSVDLVTDANGLVFEHNEYFPSGELWIHESSTTHRTPYRFVGDLNDEVRNLDVLGQRWYQPREQVFYSPEPLLYDDPGAIVDDPGVLPAYTYAESNPLRLYDDNGTAAKNAQSKLSSRFSPGQILTAWTQARRHSRLWQSLVRLALTDKSDKLKGFTERFAAKPLLAVELDITDHGVELNSVKAGFLLWDKALFERPATPAGQQAATGAGHSGKPSVGTTTAPNGGNAGGPPPLPPRPRKPLPPLPGTATAAANQNASVPPPIPPKPVGFKPIAPKGKSPSGGAAGTHGGGKPAPDSDAP